MLNIFLNTKGNVHKEFVLAGQTVKSAYYCHVLRRLRENVRRLRPELWRQKNWLLHHENAPSSSLPFSPRNILPAAHDCPPRPTLLFPVSSIENKKLKGCHFDTIVVMEAESQAVLNTLTEHDFQDAFKNGRSVGNVACTLRG
jgi:hypothetical protein